MMLLSKQGKPRVAVISSVHRWNDTRIFVKQACSLAASGYDVVLAAVGDQGKRFEASGVRVCPLVRRRRALRWISWLSILRIALKERVDVVHAHDPELFPLAILLRLTGCKAICDVHENVSEQILYKEWLSRPVRRPLSRLLRLAQRRLPSLCDAVILAEDSYAAAFPSTANVSIVRNFPMLPPRCKEDYSTDRMRLIYVGDVRGVRGIREYVAITGAIASQGIGVELRVVGSFADPAEERDVRAEVRQAGLTDRVIFMGRRPPEEIPDLLLQGDVGLALLHPIGNYRESYPTKMFEYMAAGLPVVASQFPLWERVLVGNDCGRVVDPLDVRQASDALLEYWHSPELRERQGRNGRAAVIRQFNWSVEAAQLQRVYGEVLRPS